MNSEWIEIESITEWEKNPRYNEHAVQQIAVSIQQFGFLNPIIVQKSSSKIICGHTRFKAAKSLNLLKVPVIFADLDDKKAAAYAIADNKLGEIASWDESKLIEILNEIRDDIDLETLGYDDAEISNLLSFDNFEDVFNEDGSPNGIEDNEYLTIKVKVPQYDYETCLETLKGSLIGFDDIVIQ